MSTLDIETIIFIGILFVFQQKVKNFQIRIEILKQMCKGFISTGMLRM